MGYLKMLIQTVSVNITRPVPNTLSNQSKNTVFLAYLRDFLEY